MPRCEIISISRRGLVCSCTWGVVLNPPYNRCRKYIWSDMTKDYREHRAEVIKKNAESARE
jgi:hypothetical protein